MALIKDDERAAVPILQPVRQLTQPRPANREGLRPASKLLHTGAGRELLPLGTALGLSSTFATVCFESPAAAGA